MDRRYVEKLRTFTAWMDGLRQRSASEPMNSVRQLVRESDYESWLYQNSNSDGVAEKRMGNVWFLADSIQQILEKGDEDSTLEDAISRMILRDLMDRQAEEDDEDRVQLLTLHASKGLEYPHVFMIGMEEELLPHRTSIEEDNIEEERRLAYVGITRARKRLVMTLAASRKQYGETIDTTPSRFLDELPQDDLTYEGWDQRVTEEEKKTRGREALQDLMRSLDF